MHGLVELGIVIVLRALPWPDYAVGMLFMATEMYTTRTFDLNKFAQVFDKGRM